MEKKSNAERNWSGDAVKEAFSDSRTKLDDSVNELYHQLDENKNEVKLHYLAHSNATSCPTDYSIASLVPEMKNLQLSEQQQQQQQEKEPEHLAGYIKAVIPPSGTLVIQHAPGSHILDVGTTIFTRNINNPNIHQDIGFISDIFGSVNEPMYALQLKHKVDSELLKLDSEVYYLSGHPSTRFVSVECDKNDRYTVMYS